ncbi:hypothetical protein [Paenibacillus bovis]|uniref:Uncharacterized protein n=1 Tax=Paenibacillus bovis TaxID=1616788 RepID=A0A172ZFN7_9BACL|nr:hypothetical protein [Paenibacillus bovis]ANF96323.1 hypothetical protein AR543_10135 [Paenibacillus bovis]
MNMNHLYTIGLSTILLGTVLTGCSNQEPVPTPVSPAANSGTANPAASGEEAGNSSGEKSGEAGIAVQQDNSEAASADRPPTQTNEMLINGELSKHRAVLTEGEGYSLYVYEELQLKNNRLFMKSNPEYYAEIEPLPADFNLDELRQQGKKELAATSEVKEYSGDTIGEPLTDARLFLQAGNEKLLQNFVVWEPKGEQGFIFRMHQPLDPSGEQTIGGLFGPLVYDSLASVHEK